MDWNIQSPGWYFRYWHSPHIADVGVVAWVWEGGGGGSLAGQTLFPVGGVARGKRGKRVW